MTTGCADICGRASSPEESERPSVGLLYPTTPGYLQVMKIPLLRGRFFNEHDDQNGQSVMVIDEITARTLFPNEDPIGKRIVVGTGGASQIVGVVGHVKHSGLDDDVTARFHLQLYYPVVQLPDAFLKFVASGAETFILRTSPIPWPYRRCRAAKFANRIPMTLYPNIQPMDEIVAGTLASRRFLLALLGTFAGIALLLASVGIYGVISYSVSQRTREIGIRMALGARPGDILRSVVGQGAILFVAGIALGVVASVLSHQVHDAASCSVWATTDPLTFFAVALALSLVATCASFLPALRGSEGRSFSGASMRLALLRRGLALPNIPGALRSHPEARSS